jgi:hypothetical protein
MRLGFSFSNLNRAAAALPCRLFRALLAVLLHKRDEARPMKYCVARPEMCMQPIFFGLYLPLAAGTISLHRGAPIWIDGRARRRTAEQSAVPLAHLLPPTVSVRNRYRVLIVANGAVHNGLAVHRDAWGKAVARRTQFKPVNHLFRTELPQLLNQRAINHDVSPSARFRSCGRALWFVKNRTIFPLRPSHPIWKDGEERN